MTAMPDLRGHLRRLAPRDPRDRGRYIFAAVCAVIVAALVVALIRMHAR